MTKKSVIKNDVDPLLTEVISLRIETSLKEDLENEMKEKGFRRLSRYIRFILEKRKSRGITGSENYQEIGRKEYDNLAEQYKKVASQLAMIQRMKNPEQNPIYNTEALTKSMDALKNATIELVTTLKKHMENGNRNSK